MNRNMQKPLPVTRGRRKDAGKRDAILLAAQEMFLAHGYVGTSMNNLAVAACVSKATLYSHFEDKGALFRAIIERKVKDYRLEEFSDQLCGDMARDMEIIALSLQDLIFDEQAVSMTRMVITEARTQSPIVKLFEEAGPKRVFERIADYFLACKQNGVEGLGCPHADAELFTNLVVGHRPYTQVLMGVKKAPRAAMRKERARSAVSAFLTLKKI